MSWEDRDMKKILFVLMSALFAMSIYTGCSKSQMAGFQANDQEPAYSLLRLFEGFPALNSLVESLDSQKLNEGLGDMMINGYETPLFLRDAVGLVEAPFLVPMINELHGVLNIMMDRANVYHYDDPDNSDGGYYDSTNGSIDRLAQFYAALDMVVTNTNLGGDVLAIAEQVVDYLVTEKNPREIESDMGNMMKVRFYDNNMYDETSSSLYIDLPVGTYSTSALGAHAGAISSISVPIGIKVTIYDGDNQSGNSLELTSSDRCLTDNGTNWNNRTRSVKIEYDIAKLAKLAGKVTMSCDYPMWVNSSNVPATNRDAANSGAYTVNTDLGNAAKGVIKLLYGLNTIAASDETVRTTIDAMILEDLPALLNSDANATTKIENAIVNMSNYFAADEIGTSTYESSTDYHNTAVNGYVNASFKETLRDMLPTLVKLFIRNDGTGSADYSIINAVKQSPVEAIMVGLGKLKAAGIDYSDSANALEPTLKRTMQYNGRMKDRTSDSAWSQMSYLDHLIYTVGAAYNFGFLARVGSASEEGNYTNFNYGHGIATKGIITINDSMFSLTSKDSLSALSGSVIPGCGLMDSYALALAKRNTQGNHISRSYLPFSYTQRDSHKFYLGYDYPTMLLLPSNCAGDAGIPNGGETAVEVDDSETETNAATLSSTNYKNDYRTYWPRVPDGKGVLNTSQFLMGWVARVAWDGQGPYYSTTYANDSIHPATVTYTMPVNGRKTVNVYYKPNGEVYAYVYKPSSSPTTWEYFYPNSTQTGIGDDIADPDDANAQRANRYQDIVKSDYYLIDMYELILLIPYARYNMPPMNEAGSNYVEGTTDAAKYKLKSLKSSEITVEAKQFKLYERISHKQETSAGSGISTRECETQEEAIYRNIQWFLYEKKMVFIIPMYIDVLGTQSAGAFILIEANGAVGLANAKKGTANGRWVKLGSEGIPATNYNSNYNNFPDYGDSNRPGDGRIMVFCREINLMNLGIAYINPDFLFNKVLGGGYVLPDAVGRNIEPVARMAFLTENAVDILSDDRTATWTTAWANKNKLAPVLAALTGVLHDGTLYNKSASGYNYNYSPASPHKYPMADLLEGVLMPLGKPMFRRFSTSSGRWVQRVKNETGDDYQYFNPNVAIDNDGTVNPYSSSIDNYIPRDSLRTPISVLTGNSASGYDGVLPMMADGGGMVTRLLGLLQLLGSDTYAEPRANIALGLEQVMTAAKFNKSEAIANGYFTTLDFSKYAWMFNRRNEDLDLEDFLGYEGEYRASGADWSSFEDTVDMLKSFVGGSRNITRNLVNVTNAVLAQQLTEDQVHGLLYTAGKLFARYNQVYPAGAWQYHGYDHGPGKTDSYDQLVDVLTYLPQVHEVMKSSDGSGVKYDRMLHNVDYLLKNDNSILHTIIEDMTTPYSAQAVIEDLDRFLSWSIVSDPNSPLWDDLGLMLEAMADMNDPRIDINVIIKNLGFQSN